MLEIITIKALDENDELTWQDVPGLRFGHLGVFENGFKLSGLVFWSVTHLPSGHRICSAVSLEAAKEIVAILLTDPKIDWSKSFASPIDKIPLANKFITVWLSLFQANGWLHPNCDLNEKIKAAREKETVNVA